MGRSYFVEDVVEKYILNLVTAEKAFTTGLLIGQCSPQRDFVVLAVQTAQREEQFNQPKQSKVSLVDIDEDWVIGHARQVSRMLPGGLEVLGVFLIASPELSKESQNTLRRLVFAVEKSVVKGRLWKLSEDDVSERVTLHICSKTRKVTCRTFDVQDPKSSAKPADWKYQPGLSSSWSVLQCSVKIDLHIPVPEGSSVKNLDKYVKNRLQKWANLVEDSVILINGHVRPNDKEFTEGQKKTTRGSGTQQNFNVQLLMPLTGDSSNERLTALVEVCSESIQLNGVVHCKAYIHSNKPKVKNAIQALKRDVLNTVSVRTEMLFEDILLNEDESTSKVISRDRHDFPRRVYAQVPGCSVCMCDYIFPDEAVADLQEHFREILDCDIEEEQIDVTQEAIEAYSNVNSDAVLEGNFPQVEDCRAPTNHTNIQRNIGVVMAVGMALLATAFSLFYFSD
nr:PREDICTED: protein odr-4 homolog [Lepisosteus oculatus]XP_015210554.1 PREDICTED: protein odr-4 homolog [Lepisosteus oculatus]